jgi:carbamoyl-phosphate synthase large subunit
VVPPQIARIVGRALASSPPLADASCCARQALGFSDAASPRCAGATERRGARGAQGARTASAPVYKRVDTCAAEFEAHTPYLYSTYETRARRARPTGAR